MENGLQKNNEMKITYQNDFDLLYIRFDEQQQTVTNQIVNDNIVLDIGADGKIVGIEFTDASNTVNIEQLFPVVSENISQTRLAS